jgi:hypothetical protein
MTEKEIDDAVKFLMRDSVESHREADQIMTDLISGFIVIGCMFAALWYMVDSADHFLRLILMVL